LYSILGREKSNLAVLVEQKIKFHEVQRCHITLKHFVVILVAHEKTFTVTKMPSQVSSKSSFSDRKQNNL